MPKKAPGERWRYIAFRIESVRPFARNDFLSSLLAKAKGTLIQNDFRITVFEPEVGILKVPHRFKDEAIEVLTKVDSVMNVPCKVVTLRTSGTIKNLKRQYLKATSPKQKTRE
ncbi:MAG: Rpp14/Pop5 family protein [Candidatus Thermoplasmatota archaeon]|nr:Rpp14/Pop5 family protein [Candidatus Thermoplasmatota archaeon]